MWPFCAHDWQIGQVDKIPSAHEETLAAGRSIDGSFGSDYFRSMIVYHYKCARCGKVSVRLITSP